MFTNVLCVKFLNLQQELDNPYYPTINSVIERVTAELKQILKKDFNKKMIESTAFKSFEVWWDEQSRKTRQMKPKEDPGQPLQVQYYVTLNYLIGKPFYELLFR